MFWYRYLVRVRGKTLIKIQHHIYVNRLKNGETNGSVYVSDNQHSNHSNDENSPAVPLQTKEKNCIFDHLDRPKRLNRAPCNPDDERIFIYILKEHKILYKLMCSTTVFFDFPEKYAFRT
ncbi:hypothetical protein BpHYR1_007595 [Brachionus plicatilis]|uniref:Uncharacterized protein n=1 Tax=Brachionus plicatilis TaxID=10195 RepID=A0A3M7R172_BRAPC|nr:hypothetical protein BpHYR1_007595 [Brachionus plicatilis]